MKKKRFKKIEFILFLIVIIQIFLLFNMTFASSYIIHQTDNLIENSIIEQKPKNDITTLIGSGLNLLIGFLSIKQIGIVSAQETTWYCCADTCDPIISTDTESCENIIETSCDATADCIIGCCYDSDEGICTENSPKTKCTEDGGIWYDDESCSIDKCQNICCILPGTPLFITERQCEKTGGVIEQIFDESACFTSVATQFEGACIKDGKCTFTTEEACLSKSGKHYIDYLCSYPELNTGCEEQTDVGCVNGKDEIYWFDSCGNRENIYSSDETESWNGGKVLSKELSCNDDTGNINSKTCGNCINPLSICSETGITEYSIEDGNYICKDLGCKDAPSNTGKQDRLHGESWCLYDGYIGDGKDTVGSEHWKAYCNEGEVEIDKCPSSYRGYICQESTIEEDSKTFSQASCVPNQGTYCVMYNPLDEDGNTQKCQDNKHCMIKNINVDDYFKFDRCVPRYPKGTNLRDGADDNLCSIGTVSCSVVYKKKFLSGWEAIENEACETSEFSQKMNDLCISLGDCGSYVNYNGEGTDNVIIKGKKGFELDSDGKETEEESEGKPDTPSIYSWTNYKNNAKPVIGQHVKPQNIDEFLAQISGSSSEYSVDNPFKDALGNIPGVTGGAYLLNAWIISDFGILFNIGAVGAGLFTAAGCIAIGMALAGFLADKLGLSGIDAVAMMIAGGTAGLMVSLKIIFGQFGTLGLIGFLLSVIYIFVVWFFGIGKRETRIVEFTCQAWEAPTFTNFNTAQSNCEMCNNDPSRPCTKYRCESLGQTCNLLNENEENPLCESLPYEPNPPVVTYGEITANYFFDDVQEKSVAIKSLEEGECIPEFTPVYFTLKTDEAAQCKYSFEVPPSIYEEMIEDYPLEQNAFTEEHTFEIWMPSLDSSFVYNVTGDLKEMFGNMNIYVRCQDYWENFNIDTYVVKFCVNSGPDETAVNHALTTTNPKNDATLEYGTSESELTMWINEPADCKYDIVPGKDYDEMSNDMDCELGFSKSSVFGWPCKTTLTDLIGGENKFYIKCKDKPWVTDDNIEEYGGRNINKDDYEYTLDVSSSELQIDSVIFTTIVSDKTITISSGEIFSVGGVSSISVDMKVQTSGGMDGEASCYWGVIEDGNRYLFYNTFSDTHKQLLTPRLAGTHINYIECEDDAGNNAQTISQFIIEIDPYPPKVVRTYYENGKLNLITNEQAVCYYDFNSCGFNINAETMKFDSVGYSLEHTADWITGQIYYIKCEDIWGTPNTDCAIKIIPSS